MVLTRSRTNSASGHGPAGPARQEQAVELNPPSPPPSSPLSSNESNVIRHSPPLVDPVLPVGLPAAPPPPVHVQAMPHAPPPAHAAPAPMLITPEQLSQLIQSLQAHPAPATVPSHNIHAGNFSKCTHRFDGAKGSDVLAFIDAIKVFKDCVSMEDDIALRGLPMLLTGLAATWWQGIKRDTHSWTEALDCLRQTYGPRLPPHRIYRELFKEEQGKECTDVFVCKARALLSQLPASSLTESVELDMVYGLLNKRIREKIDRSTFKTFAELLQLARRIEDLFDEGRTPTRTESSVTSSASTTPSVATKLSSESSKSRPKCNYCKQYGHLKEDCQRLKIKSKTDKPLSPVKDESMEQKIVCFGCGTPGVIRSNCQKCKQSSSLPKASFQSVSAVGVQPIDARGRPLINISIFGIEANVLIDTGAKQCVASVSLQKHLVSNGQKFDLVNTEIRLADGTSYVKNLYVAKVNVNVSGFVVPTMFIVLPGATDTLLGMNFIKDAGMMIDFKNSKFSLFNGYVGTLLFEDSYPPTTQKVNSLLPNLTINCASLCLREDEGVILSSDEKVRLSELLKSNEDIFALGGEPTTFAMHRIDTGDSPPVAVPPYRLSSAKKDLVRAEIDRMLEDEIIEEAESEWASPIVLVPKKNGEIRFCVDYRALNKITKTDKYPLPVIDDVLQSTKLNNVMSTIDLKSGYWQIQVALEDRDKTAFISPFGMFRFRRMPFGLKNSPSTFQRLVDRFRSGLKDITVVAYLDDILVISADLDSHLKDLQQVFDRLRLFGLRANRAKCAFAREKLTYLGHVISSQGVEPDPAKVQAVVNMKPPKGLKELKTFLQTTSWFRKFIPDFSNVARPLSELTRKNKSWTWGEDQVVAFESLKRLLTTSHILQQPDFNKPFVIRTDASAYALGAVLLQGDTVTEEQPIEYASRLLTQAEKNYSTTEREALAVVWALEKFRPYVEGASIKIATDHQPLKWLLSLKSPSGRLARWALKIQGYNLTVDYTPGKMNVLADTLSRPVVDNLAESAICEVGLVVIDWPHRTPEEVRCSQLEDPTIAKIIEDLERDGEPATQWTERGYYVVHGVLYKVDLYGDSEEPLLVVPETKLADLMKELHDAPTAGHLGLDRTVKKIRERYFFPNMRSYVAKYIKDCELCQRYKPTNLKPAGLLQTPVPQHRFEVLAMDLFGPLPETDKGEKWVFLVEDVASRWVEIFPMVNSTADACAQILIEEVFLRYGFPRRIISDNGTQFVSAVMQKAFLVLDIKQNLTPFYHPEANPAERKNRDMKQMLAMLVGPEHRNWAEALPAVRFALNTACNQGTGQSAAYLTFAREFRSPLANTIDLRPIIEQENYVPQVTPYLRKFAEHLMEMKLRVEGQQDARKVVADRRRRPAPNFEVGDLVLVESRILSDKSKGITHKFAPRREGPFTVGRVCSPVSYELLDSNGLIKGKYHTSFLTSYSGQAPVATAKKRGRPVNDTGSVLKSVAKPVSDTPAIGLEGEDVAFPNAAQTSRPQRERRLPAKYRSN